MSSDKMLAEFDRLPFTFRDRFAHGETKKVVKLFMLR